jgi:hypothetical protein
MPLSKVLCFLISLPPWSSDLVTFIWWLPTLWGWWYDMIIANFPPYREKDHSSCQPGSAVHCRKWGVPQKSTGGSRLIACQLNKAHTQPSAQIFHRGGGNVNCIPDHEKDLGAQRMRRKASAMKERKSFPYLLICCFFLNQICQHRQPSRTCIKSLSKRQRLDGFEWYQGRQGTLERQLKI